MEDSIENRSPYIKNRRSILGILAIFIGILLLASNFGYLPKNAHHIIISWEMLLIVIGFIQIINHTDKPIGYIILAIGVFFITPDVFHFSFNFMRLFWPILLVILGISLIMMNRSIRYRSHHISKQTSSESIGYIDEVNIFAGSKRKIVNQAFKGGKSTNIFGGSEIDLSQAKLESGKYVFEITCIFGGMSLIVPSDWVVYTKVTSIFGEFKDRRTIISTNEKPEGELTIIGLALFGGGDIKSS